MRDEQVYAQNYLGNTSFYGWFISWLWPPMKAEEREDRETTAAEEETPVAPLALEDGP